MSQNPCLPKSSVDPTTTPIKTPRNGPSAENNGCGWMVLGPASFIRKLNGSTFRLPSTYVGVRRVRPSSKSVHQALKQQQQQPDDAKRKAPPAPADKPRLTSNVVYKIVDPETGEERRMTSIEKKKAKKLRKRELQQLRASGDTQDNHDTSKNDDMITDRSSLNKGCSISETGEQQSDPLTITEEDDEMGMEMEVMPTPTHKTSSDPNSKGDPSLDYVQLKVNQNTLEEELADLQGQRDGVPPVWLSSAQAHTLASVTTLDQSSKTSSLEMRTISQLPKGTHVELDEAYSKAWASALKQESLQPAETTRRNEQEWRSMPYELVPQLWTRFRPNTSTDSTHRDPHAEVQNEQVQVSDETGSNQNVQTYPAFEKSQTTIKTTQASSEVATDDASVGTPDAVQSSCKGTNITCANGTTSPHSKEHLAEQDDTCPPMTSLTILPFSLRPRRQILYDTALNWCVEYLHQSLGLHVACGAKFGCDILLYDAPRSERHAFAGLRVEVVDKDRKDNTSCAYPLPRAYDLSGYVRCLNTAGKLALLATVVLDDEEDHLHESKQEASEKCTEAVQGRGKGDSSGCRRVAILDLALVRVRNDEEGKNKKTSRKTNSRKRKTWEERYQNLTKRPATK